MYILLFNSWLLDYRWWNVHYGDFGNWHVALALLGWEPLTVGATTLFGAVSGGNFTIALAASVVVDLLGHGGVDANANASGEAASSEASATVVDNTNLSGSFQVQRVPRSSRTHYILATAYFVITLVTGSMYTTFAPTPTFFYQRPIGHFAPHYTQITCLIRGTLNSTAQHLASETDPSQRSKLVLWSETSITVRNETAFLQEAMALSERFDVHLGLAYALRVDKGVYKMVGRVDTVCGVYEGVA